jgi:hypothetical protein
VGDDAIDCDTRTDHGATPSALSVFMWNRISRVALLSSSNHRTITSIPSAMSDIYSYTVRKHIPNSLTDHSG